MDCAEEAVLVRRALAGDRAVHGIEFDLVHGFVDIGFDATRTSEAAILTTVRSTGLPVHAVHGDAGHQAVAAEHAGHLHDHEHHSAAALRATWASGVLFAAGWAAEGLAGDHWFDTFIHHAHDRRAAVLYGLSAAAGLWPMWRRALASIRLLRLDMHALVCLTVVGAAAIGEWSEGAAVAFLFAFAHRIEAWSIERARAEVAALIGRGPSLVADGLSAPAPVERWIERFAAVYTPAVTGAALLVALGPPLLDGDWATWFYRALVFLVLACPCALVISTPTVVGDLYAFDVATRQRKLLYEPNRELFSEIALSAPEEMRQAEQVGSFTASRSFVAC
jgi:cation transport ATPase